MENSESWRLMLARMNRLGEVLDRLTHLAMELMKASTSIRAAQSSMELQSDMTRMRVEARRLVKTLRKNVQTCADKESKSKLWSYTDGHQSESE